MNETRLWELINKIERLSLELGDYVKELVALGNDPETATAGSNGGVTAVKSLQAVVTPTNKPISFHSKFMVGLSASTRKNIWVTYTVKHPLIRLRRALEIIDEKIRRFELTPDPTRSEWWLNRWLPGILEELIEEEKREDGRRRKTEQDKQVSILNHQEEQGDLEKQNAIWTAMSKEEKQQMTLAAGEWVKKFYGADKGNKNYQMYLKAAILKMLQEKGNDNTTT